MELANLSTTHLYLVIGVGIAIIFAMFYFLYYNINKLRDTVMVLQHRMDQLDNETMGLEDMDFGDDDEEDEEDPEPKKVRISETITEESSESEEEDKNK